MLLSSFSPSRLRFTLACLALVAAGRAATFTYTDGQPPNTTPLTINGPGNVFTIGTGTAAQSGAIDGTGQFIKSGAGTLTLQGINTYSGGTRIVQGTLALDLGGSIGGSLQVDASTFLHVLAGGSLNLTSGGNLSAGTILFASNAATSSGTLINQNAVNFTGTASAGTLSVFATTGTTTFSNSSTAGAGQIRAEGGTTVFNDTSTAGTATLRNLSSGATRFNGNASAGSATLGNSGDNGLFQFNGQSTAASAVITGIDTVEFNDTATASSATIGGNGTIQFKSSSTAGTASFNRNGGGVSFNGSSTAGSATLSFTGGSLSFNDTATAGTANVTLGGNALASFNDSASAGSATIANSGNLTFNESSDAGAASLTNTGSLFFKDSSTAGSASVTSNANLDVSAHTGGIAFGALAGTGGNLYLGANAVTIGGLNTSTTFAGVIQDGGIAGGTGGALVKTGTGTLSLSGSNTFTGGVTLNAGTLGLASGGALGTGALTINGGGIRAEGDFRTVTNATTVNGDFTLGRATNFSGAVTLGNNVTITAANPDASAALTSTFSGAIGGGYGVTFTAGINPGGPIVLSGVSTYTGTTTVAGGTLRLSGGNDRLPTGATLYLLNGATLDLNGLSQQIGDLGSPSARLVGNITAGTISSTTNIFAQGGTFDAAFTGSSPGARLWIGGDPGATLTLNGANDRVYTADNNQVIIGHSTTGAAGTVKLGSASSLAAASQNTEIWSGTVDLNGQTNVRGNRIAFMSGTSGALVNNSGSASFGGEVRLNASTQGSIGGSGDLTLSGQLTGAGAFTKTGTGTLTLTNGTNDYSGGTTINAGTLTLGGDNVLGTALLTINGGGLRAGGSSRVVTNPVALNGSFTLGRSTAFQGAVTLGADVTITSANPDSGAAATSGFSGVISGGHRLTFVDGINPTGTIVLYGTNTYSGGTVLSSGTLELGGSGTVLADTGAVIVNGGTFKLGAANETVGSLAGTGGTVELFNGAGRTLTVGGDNTSTSFAGVIQGSGGALVKNGTGTLGLSGANSYSGGTTLNAGTLTLDGDNVLGNGTLTINGGGLRAGGSSRVVTNPVALNSSFTLGRSTAFQGAVTLGADVTITSANPDSGAAAASGFSGVISGGHRLTFVDGINPTGTIILSGTNSYTGGTTLTSGTLELGSSGTVLADTGAVTVNGGRFKLGAANETIGSLAGTGGTVDLFNGAGRTLTVGGDNTSTSFAGVIEGTNGALVKNGTGTLSLSGANTYSGGTTLNAGTLGLAANNVLGTGTLTINGGSLRAEGSPRTLPNAVALNGSFTLGRLTNLSGAIALGGDVTITSANPDPGAVLTSTLSGVVSGAHGLTFADGTNPIGTIVLSGTNTYTGGTTLTSGTLQLGDSGTVLANTGAVTVNGGTLKLGAANETIGSLAGTGGTVELFNASGRTLTLGGNDASTTFGGVIQGAGGALVKNGTGTLTLTGANTYTGNTTVSAGTLQVGNGGTTGSIAGNIVADGALVFNRSDTVTFNGSVSGSGSVTQGGTGTLILPVTHTYTGGTTVSAGTLLLGDSGTVLADSGGVTVNGGTFKLGAANETIGSLAGSGGTIELFNGAGRALTVGGNNATSSYAGVIQGAGGALVKNGSGILTLSGTHTFSGGTTLNAGTLQLGDSGTVLADTGAVTVSGGTFKLGAANETIGSLAGTGGTVELFNGAGRTLTLGGNDATTTFGGVIQGAGGALVKSGTGTLTLAGTNTYSGGTTLTSGTLALGDSGTVLADTGAVTVNSGTFKLGGANEVIGSLAGTGGTVELFNGAGRTLTLGGDNTSTSYAGVIQGTGGALVKNGTGTLTLTGTSTYSGGTTITGGAVNFASPGNFGSGPITLNGGGLQWATGNTTDVTASSQFNRTLGVSGGTFDTNGNLVTFGLALSGGALTKAGPGTLVLTAANTYSGGTTISGGTLQVGAGGAAGSLAGDVANAAALVFNRSDALTFGGAISGAGTLTKSGTGVLTLSGDLTYTGGTTISGGTLKLSGSMPGNIVNNAALDLSVTGSAAYSGNISGTGALTTSAAGIVTLSGANTYTGTTTISAGTLRAGAANALSAGSTVSLTNVAGAKLDLAGYSQTIKGLSGGGTSGGNVELGSATLTLAGNTGSSFNGVISGSGNLVKSGTAGLTLTGSNTYTGTTTLSAGTLTISGATGAIVGNLVNNAQLFWNRTTDFTYSGAMSGTGGLSKSLGDSVLTLTGSYSSTGGVQIGHGTIRTGVADLFATAPFVAVDPTGTLDLNDISQTVKHLVAVSGGSILLGSATLTLADPSNSTIIAAIMSGTGSLVKTGAPTVTLNGENTFTGTTTISAGTLQLGNGSTGTTGSVAGDIINHGILSFHRAADLAYGGQISGTGSLTKANTNILTLSGNNTFTGNVAITGGTLVLGSAGALGSTGIISMGATSGTLRFTAANTNDYSARLSTGSQVHRLDTNGQTVTFAANLSGTSLLKSGTGTLILAGADSYSAASTVSAGTLQIGNGGTTGSFAGNLTNNAEVAFNRSDMATFNGAISGSGAVSQLGTGLTRLASANSYTGATNIAAGTLQLGVAGALPANTPVTLAPGATLDLNGLAATVGKLEGTGGTVALNGGATLTVSQTANATFAGALTGNGALAKNGGGTLTLTGTSDYTGGTTLNAGTLRLSTDGALGAAAGAVGLNGGVLQAAASFTAERPTTLGTSGGSFDPVSGATVVWNGGINGGGPLRKLGLGELVLGSINAFTGATAVDAGTLRVNGTLSASTVTVNDGGTLAGSGTFGALATVASGGTLAPGNSPGTLTFENGLTLAAGSSLEFQLGSSSDLIAVTGGTLTGPLSGMVTLNLSNSGGFTPGTYTLFNFVNGGTSDFDLGDFTFGSLAGGSLGNYSLGLGATSLTLTYTGSAIPEPSTCAALAGLAALGLAAWRRRRTR